MKFFKYIAFAIIAVCLASCGSKKVFRESSDENSLKPIETEVSGDMEGCFEVIDREYKVIGDISRLITIEIERTDEELPFNLDGKELWSYSEMGSAAHVQVGFGIEFLDADGNVLDKVSANTGGLSGPYNSDECVALVRLKPGKRGTIRFSVGRAAENAVGFRVTSAYEESEGTGGSSSSFEEDSDIESDGSSLTGSEDWDALLDAYDEYVTKYISFVKKAAKGDMNAMSEYPSLLKKAEEFDTKLRGAKGDMSESQWARYLKITNRMANAAQEM